MRYLILTVFLAICAPANSKEITIAELGNLPKADVIILGEVHDNPAHHINQATAIYALKPRAVVFEMLTRKQALAATGAMGLDEADLAIALQWQGSGWPEFSMYFPVFQAAATARIFGGNLPRKDVRRAVGEGAAAVFGVGAAQFGLTEYLPAGEQTRRESGQMAAHCDALPESLLGGMVEAQRLRDAFLASVTLRSLKETGGPVVVITGNGHARIDWGIPALLAKADPNINVQSLGQFELAAGEEIPFDNHLITQAVEREDPCAAFIESKGE